MVLLLGIPYRNVTLDTPRVAIPSRSKYGAHRECAVNATDGSRGNSRESNADAWRWGSGLGSLIARVPGERLSSCVEPDGWRESRHSVRPTAGKMTFRVCLESFGVLHGD